MAGIAAAVLAADQVTKALVLAARPPGGTGWLAIRLVRNSGASGGLASGYPVLVTLAAIAITGLAAAVMLRVRGRATALILAAVVGGALGNLADRVFRAPALGRGPVVDWIHLAGRGGSFNVADLAIQLGALGALAAMIATREKAKGQAGSHAPAQDEAS
jgi:signal peptidase II